MPIARYQLAVFDIFQRIQPREYVDAPVRVVDLDDASHERIGQWPWPRTDVAQLLVRIEQPWGGYQSAGEHLLSP